MSTQAGTLKKLWDAAVTSAMFFAEIMFSEENNPWHKRIATMEIDEIDAVVERILYEAGDDQEVLRHAIKSLLILNKDSEARASYDSMTGLHNRSSIDELVSRHLERMDRGLTETGALIYGDLDKFKSINDTYGHEAGDIAIITAAGMIAKTVRAIDVPARRGGDEFVVFMPDVNKEQAEALVTRLRSAFTSLSFNWQDRDLPIRASFGVTSIERDANGKIPSLEEVFTAADTAMYAVKQAKKTAEAIIVNTTPLTGAGAPYMGQTAVAFAPFK